jgi:hypothetical protein
MISGDRQPVAARVAREIGCEEVLGECLPQNKVDFVRQVKAKGYRVAVVGDGVNDAPALAAGDLGIAMGAAGSEVAIHSATIALDEQRSAPVAVPGAALPPNALGHQPEFPRRHSLCHRRLILAALKFIDPIVAAVLHVVGSLWWSSTAPAWCGKVRNWNRTWSQPRPKRPPAAGANWRPCPPTHERRGRISLRPSRPKAGRDHCRRSRIDQNLQGFLGPAQGQGGR